ncbi:hypothetical protein O9A_00207 [Bartonella koehlerae C-29]|uniref:Uncharacterized protein n=1 Tax=Bartonella koehlerae C-29 TaxID=1134510 RepID=A0A067WJA6_9HYPH|nr:hypothetical protein O9A_00207 [Bartonella koehlerae C-29]
MFTDMAKAKTAGFKAPTISSRLMKKFGRVAYTTYHDAKIKLFSQDIAELAAELYGKLQELIQNIHDMKEVELTWLTSKVTFKRSN